MKPRFSLSIIFFLTLAGSALSPAWGQSASAPERASPSPDAADVSIVHLETFRVNTDRDRGYIAVDSLAGGRTNTEIRLTPSAMSSLTRTFLDDTGIYNIRDALKWTPNVVPSDWLAGKQLGNPFNSWDLNFRGAGQSLQGGAGPTRNYFTFYQAVDTYNVERLEFDRGPNSILFGVGTVGGVLSIYTKVPRFDRDFTTPLAVVDSNGGYRFEADVNRRLNDTLAVRFNAVDDHAVGWRNNDKKHTQAVDLAVLYKPTNTTSIRVEAEASKSWNTLISSTYGDGISKWDRTAVSNTWGADPGGTGTRASQSAGFGTNPYNVWIPGLADKGVMNWNGGFITAGVDPDGLPVAPRAGWYPATIKASAAYPWMPPTYSTANIPVLSSRDFTYGTGVSKPKYNDVTGYLDQKLGEHFDAEISVYRYSDDHNAKDYEAATNASIDLNKQLPDGSPNPNFGKTFADFFLSQQQQNRRVTEARAQLNYHVDTELFGIPVKELLSISAGQQKINWSARQYNAQVNNPAETDPAKNLVWGRLYFDQPNRALNLPQSIGGKTITYAPWPTYWFDFDEVYKLKNAAVASHTRLWNDKLSILLGARRDEYDHHRSEVQSKRMLDDSASGTTYSAGAIYYFRWLGLFANYSKNFDPIGPGKLPGLNGQPFGPATGQGSEIGLRVSTDDRKYYASLSHYDSKSKNRIYNGGKPDFGGFWKNYYDALGQPWVPERTGLTYDDTEALHVSGYEVDITANPTNNLRLSFTYSKPESKIVDALPGARAYFANNLSTWNAVVGGASTAATDLRNKITSAQNTFTQTSVGKTKRGVVDYTASVFANYTFTAEALKGFSVGGGMTFTGKQYLEDFDGTPYFGSSQTSTALVFAYETKIAKIPTRIALNIDNVFDKKDPVITGYHWGWVDDSGRHIPNSYFLPAPRTFRLSARFTF